MGVSVQTRVRVRHPYRVRTVEVAPEQAAILRQLRRSMDCFQFTAMERNRLAKKQWKQKTSLLGELEFFDNEVAGAASWCEAPHKHPDPRKAITNMHAFDVEGLLRCLRGCPALSAYVQELAKLRQLVSQYLRQQV